MMSGKSRCKNICLSSDGRIEARCTGTVWKEQYMLMPEAPERCFETNGDQQTTGDPKKSKSTMYSGVQK